MKDKIAKLLSTKMNRRDFLKYTAATGLMAMGGGVILKSVDHLDLLTQPKQQSTKIANGYGTSIYGGQRIATNK